MILPLHPSPELRSVPGGSAPKPPSDGSRPILQNREFSLFSPLDLRSRPPSSSLEDHARGKPLAPIPSSKLETLLACEARVWDAGENPLGPGPRAPPSKLGHEKSPDFSPPFDPHRRTPLDRHDRGPHRPPRSTTPALAPRGSLPSPRASSSTPFDPHRRPHLALLDHAPSGPGPEDPIRLA